MGGRLNGRGLIVRKLGFPLQCFVRRALLKSHSFCPATFSQALLSAGLSIF